jgi:hypothetical protein
LALPLPARSAVAPTLGLSVTVPLAEEDAREGVMLVGMAPQMVAAAVELE